MTLDPNKYRRGLDGLRTQLVHGIGTVEWKVTEASCVYHIPLLAVALYALRPDVLGERADIRAVADRVTKFYNYQDVTPWKD